MINVKENGQSGLWKRFRLARSLVVIAVLIFGFYSRGLLDWSFWFSPTMVESFRKATYQLRSRY